MSAPWHSPPVVPASFSARRRALRRLPPRRMHCQIDRRGKLEGSQRCFVSTGHFVNNLPFRGRLPRHDRLLAQKFLTEEPGAWPGPRLFFTVERPMYMTPESVRGMVRPELRSWMLRHDDPDPELHVLSSASENLGDVASGLEVEKRRSTNARDPIATRSRELLITVWSTRGTTWSCSKRTRSAAW